MKLLIECVLSIVLHPIAVVLAWINLLGRADIGFVQKILWLLLITFAWGVGPILYIVLSGGQLW